MTTGAPQVFPIAIDREEFIRFSARQETIVVRLVSILPLAIIAMVASESIVSGGSEEWLPLLSMTLCFGAAFLLAWLLGKLYAATLGRLRASRRAEFYQLIVEGSFLRIIDRKSDRKIHFRQIVDYQVDPTPTPEVATLRMSTTAGGACIVVPAIKDALQTRDLLAEVDAERE